LGRDVGVPDFGDEFHFGWLVGVLLWEFDIDQVDTTLIDGIFWTVDFSTPMPKITILQRYLDV
jgi:hypothetical protein